MRVLAPTAALGLRGVTALWLAFIGGFFWAFSFTVMPALGQLEPLAALSAMQTINLAVRNAVFGLGFFGAALLALLVLVQAGFRRDRAGIPAALGAIVYLGGALMVTGRFNVPLNEALAQLSPNDPANAAMMADWIAQWTGYNHVRMTASLAAALLLGLSAVMTRRAAPNAARATSDAGAAGRTGLTMNP